MLLQRRGHLGHAGLSITMPPHQGGSAIQATGLMTLQIVYQGFILELFDDQLVLPRSWHQGSRRFHRYFTPIHGARSYYNDSPSLRCAQGATDPADPSRGYTRRFRQPVQDGSGNLFGLTAHTLEHHRVPNDLS